MDEVHQLGNDLLSDIESLGLSVDDQELLKVVVAGLPGTTFHYKVLGRGLGPCTKLVIKPDWKFPLFTKLGSADQIEQECRGYNVLFLETPSENILPLVKTIKHNGRAAIVYRFVTGGRVKQTYRRLDVALSGKQITIQRALKIFHELFQVGLLKAHFRDGRRPRAPIDGAKLYEDLQGVCASPSAETRRNLATFSRLAGAAPRSPFGIVHGDLHTKNVILTRHDCPVLIDYESASEDDCIYRDYAKFEISLQFHVSYSAPLGKRELALLYGSDLFALSAAKRYRHAYLQYVSELRGELFRRCCSKSTTLSTSDVDQGYRLYLAYNFMRLAHSPRAEKRSQRLAMSEASMLLARR